MVAKVEDIRAGIAYRSDGGRSVGLYVPFDFQGRRIESVTLAPFCLDHVLRWRRGELVGKRDSLTSMLLPLACELSGLAESTLLQLRYPDADRVMVALFDMLPGELREQITSGTLPQQPVDAVAHYGKSDNLSNFPAPPSGGEPLPDIGGFDVGDE